MKKLFSLLLVSMFLILGACESPNYDGRVTFEVYTEDDVQTRTVGYYDEDELTLFELLEEVFTVVAEDHGWGLMLMAIDDLVASEGNYIAIEQNHEPAMLGISELPYEDGDTITFRLVWWDMELKAAHDVQTALDLMLQNVIVNYVDDSPHYLVVLGLGLLDRLHDYTIAIDALDPISESALIQAIFIYTALDLDASSWISDLDDVKTIGWPYGTALSVLALEVDDTLDHSDYIHAYIADLQARNLETIDLDTLSLMMLALLVIDSENPLISEIETLLEAGLYDSAYGDNASTFANVLMALIASGIDPREARFEQDDQSLVEIFLGYQSEEGAFYYQEDDAQVDMMFSTPQAFLALVVLHLYFENNDPVHPFSFE